MEGGFGFVTGQRVGPLLVRCGWWKAVACVRTPARINRHSSSNVGLCGQAIISIVKSRVHGPRDMLRNGWL